MEGRQVFQALSWDLVFVFACSRLLAWNALACCLSEWESCPRSQGPQDCLPQARAAMAPGDGLRRRLRVSFAIGVAPDHGRLARFSGCEQGARCAGEVPEHSESLRGALCLLQAEVTAGCMQ